MHLPCTMEKKLPVAVEGADCTLPSLFLEPWSCKGLSTLPFQFSRELDCLSNTSPMSIAADLCDLLSVKPLHILLSNADYIGD